MSQYVNRNGVLKTTKVRTSLKNDGSWILRSKEETEEQEEPGYSAFSAAVKQKSYVLSTVKKFELGDAPLSPPLKKTTQGPAEEHVQNGDAHPENTDTPINQSEAADTEVVPVASANDPNTEAQPDDTVAETAPESKEDPTGDAQAEVEVPAETPAEAQPETTVADTAEENKEDRADAPVDQSNVPTETVEQETASHVEPDVTADTKEEADDATSGDPTEAKASEDAPVEEPVAETADAPAAAESVSPPEVPADAPQVKPQEEPSSEAANGVETGAESTDQPAGSRREEAAEGVFEAAPAVVVESSPDASEQMNATPAAQNQVDPMPDLVIESLSKSLDLTASDSPTESAPATIVPPEESNVEAAAPAEAAAETTADSPSESAPAVPVPPEESNVEAAAPSTETTADSPSEAAPAVPVPPEESKVEAAAEATTETTADSPSEAAPVATVQPEESKAEAPAEAATETTAECEVQPVSGIAPEAAADPEPTNVPEPVEPVVASEAETVQSESPDGLIQLTDALDVEPPAAEAAPEPKEPEVERPNPVDEIDVEEMLRKLREQQPPPKYTLKVTSDGEPVCSFCDRIIDGSVKLTFSDPLMTCHPECLQCGLCAKELGDLLTPVFIRNQEIQCDGCFFSRHEA